MVKDVFEKMDEDLYKYAIKLIKKYKLDATIGYTGTINPLYYPKQSYSRGITLSLEVSE